MVINMAIRGIRVATVATENTREAILTAAGQLASAIIAANPQLKPEDIASVLFTVTPDLNAAFPAFAVRQLGWAETPILCAQEIPVPGSLERCIRILIHWNTDLAQDQITHVYSGEARVLRPDLASG
jgi:chorismate mutase